MVYPWNKGRVNKIIQICKVCKKEHLEFPSVKPDYCSRECYYIARKSMKGPNTGKKFSEEWKNNIGKAGKGLRSKEKNPNWKGGQIKKYPSIFKRKLSMLVRQRDNFTCQKCNNKKSLIVHHIDENTQNNSLENLVTLCRSCHGKLHHG